MLLEDSEKGAKLPASFVAIFDILNQIFKNVKYEEANFCMK